MSEIKQYLTPKQKALIVNLNPNIYGTFAEIGAGQETVRHFFRAGAASQTIAKAMSAYDKDYSDAIYGTEEKNRYVTQNRLKKIRYSPIIRLRHHHYQRIPHMNDIIISILTQMKLQLGIKIDKRIITAFCLTLNFFYSSKTKSTSHN